MTLQPKVAIGYVNEDGGCSVLARVTALQGSGDEVAKGEGPTLEQADISTITCKVYDIATDPDNTSGTEVTPAPTLTPADNIHDTLRTQGWDQDGHGYNFRHDLGPTYTAEPEEWRRIEYKFTLTGGGVFFLVAKIKTVAVQTS